MKVITAPQRSLDWHRARLGVITGSGVHKIIGTGRAKDKQFSEAGMSYIRKLVFQQRLNPAIVSDDELFQCVIDLEEVSSRSIQWGIDNEPKARALYSEMTGLHVIETSLVLHPVIDGFASSPDGYADDDKGGRICLEIKCPKDDEFIKYCLFSTPEDLKQGKSEYYWQCLAHMAVTGANRTDFVAYHPLPFDPIHILPIPRELVEADIDLMLERVQQAKQEISNLILRLSRVRQAITLINNH